MRQQNNVMNMPRRRGCIDTRLIVCSGLIMIYEPNYHRIQGQPTW
jgi:hypothetical protein